MGWTLGVNAGVFLFGYLVGRLVRPRRGGGRRRVVIVVDDDAPDPAD